MIGLIYRFDYTDIVAVVLGPAQRHRAPRRGIGLRAAVEGFLICSFKG